jgi:DNA helicase-2/ATP-dependent DNA helicase PcrA
MDPLDPILAGLTPPQAEAAMHDGAILVLAGAGTGKTRTLTSAVAWRIACHGIPPNRVLTVTFTNKAAREMTTASAACSPGAGRHPFKP